MIMLEKLQKIIASAGITSRREAEKLIAQGRVKVDGRTASVGDRADADTSDIYVDGKMINTRSERVYILLNKPARIVTTMKDEKGRRSVYDLVRDCPYRVYPVGRLDYNSEGLLIMTNDGDLTYKLTHPSHEIEKTYHVSVCGEDLKGKIELLSSRMYIDGYLIEPASVRILEETPSGGLLSITIHEGRNRQIRKMCAKAALDVKSLKRVSEGKITLGTLGKGKWRYLSKEEIKYLKGL